jgi:large subunit ribosomal protein L6
MSRLGKLPIELSANTQAKLEKGFIVIKGPKGELKQKMVPEIILDIDEKIIKVSVKNPENKKENSFWGLYRGLIMNMVVGVTEGYERKLEIIGVGYRAAASGNKITLNVGYSHQVVYELPEGISGVVEGNTIRLNGIDKQLIGEVASQIRRIRKPEPYKGKGIKYAGEVIRRKEGKTSAKGK